MGYYSSFEISAIDKTANLAEIQEPLETISQYEFEWFADNTLFVSDVKWYDWEEDMMELSKQFPNAILEVNRIGEHTMDKECSIFINGQCFNAQVEFIEPSEVLKRNPKVQEAIKEAKEVKENEKNN